MCVCVCVRMGLSRSASPSKAGVRVRRKRAPIGWEKAFSQRLVGAAVGGVVVPSLRAGPRTGAWTVVAIHASGLLLPLLCGRQTWRPRRRPHDDESGAPGSQSRGLGFRQRCLWDVMHRPAIAPRQVVAAGSFAAIILGLPSSGCGLIPHLAGDSQPCGSHNARQQALLDRPRNRPRWRAYTRAWGNGSRSGSSR